MLSFILPISCCEHIIKILEQKFRHGMNILTLGIIDHGILESKTADAIEEEEQSTTAFRNARDSGVYGGSSDRTPLKFMMKSPENSTTTMEKFLK
nr:hypothetical protein Iba_chr11dCG8610 [Ipomoea batatas]